MSIQTAVQQAVQRGDLAYLPYPRSDPVGRVVLIGKEIQQLIMGATVGTASQKLRLAKLLADLQAFVRGDVISICMTPRQHKQVFVGRLAPIGSSVFDMRCREPRPSLRVLGRFARPDVFVALDWWPRWKQVPWSIKQPLIDDAQWALAITGCEAKWDSVLPGIAPVSGEKVEGYVTRNYDSY